MLRRVSSPFLQLHQSSPHLKISIRALTTMPRIMAPLKSWVSISPDSDFSLGNIPFGIITSRSSQTKKRPAIAIGDYALDLHAFSSANGFASLPSFSKESLDVFSQSTLNAFAALGRPVHREVREYLQNILAEDTKHPEILKDNETLKKEALLAKGEYKLHLPMQIGDYTDFFAGRNHAFNVGTMFRGPANALQPNYTHLPVGYHGRASSVVVSGTPIRRPNGQIILDPTADPKIPTFTPSRRLDIELELACFISTPNPLGTPVKIQDASDNIFGFVLMNDWSARDIQTWEYVPLGPFNAKNFGTTISPWVVLIDALEPFRSPKMENPTQILPYLQEPSPKPVYDISLTVELTTPEQDTAILSTVSANNLLWSFPQMITHHTIGGCPLNTGDLLGSGTISGNSEKGGDLGSLLEMNQAGKKEIMLKGMEVRKFLKDGDEITLRGRCGGLGEGVGFGECKGRIESAVVLDF